MNIPIVNRDASASFQHPEDGWYHVIPKGRFPHAESGQVQVLDDAAHASIVNRFREESKRANFAGLLIDEEHFSYNPDKSSAAFGWLMELENRASGTWARIKWTPDGKSAVKNGTYRFISPVWLPSEVERLGNKEIRPLRLDTAGLTNSPNLKGMIPLSNRAARPEMERQVISSTRMEILTDPDEAGRELGMLANRLAVEHNITTEMGWDMARTNRPDLAKAVERGIANALNGRPMKTGPSRFSAEAITNRLLAIRNRGATKAESYWSAVMAEEPEVYARIVEAQSRRESGLPVHGTKHSIGGLFNNRMKELQGKREMSFEEAWNWMRENEPSLFAAYIVENS